VLMLHGLLASDVAEVELVDCLAFTQSRAS